METLQSSKNSWLVVHATYSRANTKDNGINKVRFSFKESQEYSYGFIQEKIQSFVDTWTGEGTITVNWIKAGACQELRDFVEELNNNYFRGKEYKFGKRYLLSNKIYSHHLHKEWLNVVNLTAEQKQKLRDYGRNIMGGWYLERKNEEFANSVEYNHIKHELDKVSGTYVDVIKPYARQLIQKKLEEAGVSFCEKDLLYTTNFSGNSFGRNQDTGSDDWYANNSFYFHADDNQFYSVSFEEAEKFAYE